MNEGIMNILGTPQKEVDLRSSDGIAVVLKNADSIIKRANGDIGLLKEIEISMFLNPDKYSMQQHMAIKAAESKSIVNKLTSRIHLSIIVPMYHEERRIAPRVGSKIKIGEFEFPEDEHGENVLLRRNLELEWLTNNNNLITYDLLFVDDMCNSDSGILAQELVKKNGLRNCKVSFLKEAIESNHRSDLEMRAIETIINNEGNSIRGGALCLGFAQSIEMFEQSGLAASHIIGYMDADSSYSASQIGIPLELITQPDVFAATASRQHPLTYMDTPRSELQTSHRSPGLIRLKQTVGYLRKHIVGDFVPSDTQSGFKLFKPNILKQTLLQPNKAHNFSYDTQLLARIAQMEPQKPVIKTFGVTLVDSDELSTANNGMTYFAALEILKVISNENGYHIDNNEAVLLGYLTSSVDNYKHAIHILEDSADCNKHPELIESIRKRIRTDKDTTAVGDYFTSDICSDMVTALKSYHVRKEPTGSLFLS